MAKMFVECFGQELAENLNDSTHLKTTSRLNGQKRNKMNTRGMDIRRFPNNIRAYNVLNLGVCQIRFPEA